MAGSPAGDAGLQSPLPAAGRSPGLGAAAAASPQSPGGTAAKERPPARGRENAVAMQLAKTKMCAFFERGRCASAQCRYAHAAAELRSPPNLQKTKLCRAFLQGNCLDGEGCVFAHGDHDLRVTEGIYKTQICNFFERGYCKKGERCNHAHGVSDLRPAAAQTAAPPQARQVAAVPAAVPGDAARLRRSPLLLAELLVDAEGNACATAAPEPAKSVTELASLAFSPLPSSPLWGRYGQQPASPASALSTGEPTPPPWPREPVAVDLSERLASLDAVVRDLAADVAGLRGTCEGGRERHRI